MCVQHGTASVQGPLSSSGTFDFVDNSRKICRLQGIVYFLLTVSLLTLNSHALPISSPNRGNVSNSAISQTVDFLTKYGYLPASGGSTGNLRTDAQLRDAIAVMQKFGGLQPTGLIDEDTVHLMGQRRCGVPDMVPGGHERVRRYALQGQKWPITNLTWSVKSSNSEADVDMVRVQLRKAFSVWSSASALTFLEVQGLSADILVSFLKGQHGDGYPFDGEGSVLAHAFFPGEGIGGDAHFDAEERWLPSQPESEDEGVNLFAVAAHEIGHSLGLSHSSTPGSLMFPYYQVMGEYFTLPKDDADGIRHLYGYKDPQNQPTMPTIAPTIQTASTKRNKVTTKKAVQKPLKPTKESPIVEPAIPEVCNTSVDAVSVIRREVFVFKGKHFWRLDANRTLRAGYPVTIDRFWNDFPNDIERIDAVYERPSDTKIVFFSGKRFWLFSANVLEAGYPRPLTDLGLPDDLKRLDAAFVWGHNGKTYFFSGKEYWKFDETEGRVELDYPRNIVNAWRGVPTNLDAAFQWMDGKTYFFKGIKFWKFIDIKMRVENKGPFEIGNFWFNCASKTVEFTEPLTTMNPQLPRAPPIESSAVSKVPNVYLNSLVIFIAYSLLKFTLI